MEKLSRSHDGFFRRLMSETSRVKQYLNAYLPEPIKRMIVFDTLELDNDSYIDEKLKQSFSDVVFKAETDAGIGINLCFLFEHKSYIDEKAPFQMLHYVSSAMLRRAENKELQRLILPILFYHGKDSWKYQTIFDHFPELSGALSCYLPNFDYIYHDLQRQSDKDIEERFDSVTAASFLALKHYHNRAYLVDRMRFFLLGSIDEEGNLYKPLIVYYLNKIPGEIEKIEVIMSEIPAAQQPEFISALDAYENRGADKKTKQTCINMIRLGMEINLICEALEVDEDYVKNVINDLDQNTY